MCDNMPSYDRNAPSRVTTMKQAKLLTDAEQKRFAAVIDSLRHSTRNHTAVALSFYAHVPYGLLCALAVEKDYFAAALAQPCC
jgi:2-iminoacetate synthase ThiH